MTATINELETIIIRLTNKRQECQQLLDFGAVRIEEEKAKGVNVTAWEDAWQDLLKQYGALSDQLTIAHKQLKRLEKGAA